MREPFVHQCVHECKCCVKLLRPWRSCYADRKCDIDEGAMLAKGKMIVDRCLNTTAVWAGEA